MTSRIGNKDEAHQRSKEEKARIKASNIAQEAVKKAAAAAKYHNEIKGHPRAATTVDEAKTPAKKKATPTAKAKPVKTASKTVAKPAKPKATKAAKTVKASSSKTTKAKDSKTKAGADKVADAKKADSKKKD